MSHEYFSIIGEVVSRIEHALQRDIPVEPEDNGNKRVNPPMLNELAEVAGLTKTYLDRYLPGMRQRGLSAGRVWS